MEKNIPFNLILTVFYVFAFSFSDQMVTYGFSSDLTDGQSTGSSYFFYQQPTYPRDCQEIQSGCSASNSSGVYVIKPDGYSKPFEVFCDNSDESGGWTVIYRRTDGSITFKRSWTDYKHGFGFPSSEFWLGNEKLSFLTNQKTYELQLSMVNSADTSFYVRYNLFRISDEWGNYRIVSLGEFNGNPDFETCPVNMLYDNCTCQKTCSNPRGCSESCIDGEEACVCRDGYMLDEEANCVIENNCNCFVQEFGVVPDGLSYVTSDCTQRCFCNNNQLNCNNLRCNSEATCQPIEGSHQCQCKEGFIGDGVTSCIRSTTSPPVVISDCFDLYNAGTRANGVYTIFPAGWSSSGFPVYCDMTTDGGGWTVFQRRRDGAVNFYRGWYSYKTGFGGRSGEHWLGNDKIHTLTRQKDYQLRIDMVDSGGSSYYAMYSRFGISNENDTYRLSTFGSFSGTAGNNAMYWNKDEPFSTRDRDNDASSKYHCAQKHRGGWWYLEEYFMPDSYCYSWPDDSYYKYCTNSNLNGNYSGDSGQNIFWYDLPGNDCYIAQTEMKIRPIQ